MLRMYVRHFCSKSCRATYYNTHHPDREQEKWVELICPACQKPFQRQRAQAKLRHTHYCSKTCYWNARRTYASCYWWKDVDQAPKQVLVHFLAAHSVGAYGKMGEDILILAKSNFYLQEPTEACNPLHVLVADLRKIGHTKLASMVEDGSWKNQDLWPATRNTPIIHANKSCLPWENQW
jgi:hypothetical protein